MSDPLADTTARLQPLVQQAMQETDPDKSDELYAEIWRVLRERDEVRKALRFASRGWLMKQIIALRIPAPGILSASMGSSSRRREQAIRLIHRATGVNERHGDFPLTNR
jgi:hypothetical protein